MTTQEVVDIIVAVTKLVLALGIASIVFGARVRVVERPSHDAYGPSTVRTYSLERRGRKGK